MEKETYIADAKKLRQEYYGKDVHLRGIIEFSNYCRQNCLYCGLRRENRALPRYRLSVEDILATAEEIKRLGISTVVLQSGEDLSYGVSNISRVIEGIKKMGLTVTLSLGERSREDYTTWRNAGADRYLLKMETFCEARHKTLRWGAPLSGRLTALQHLVELGYECGSGIICGLPDETPKTIAYDMGELAKLNLKMISVSPFIPHPDTPLRAHPAYGIAETLRLMAIARINTPSAHIPVTSAMSQHGDAVRLQGLEIGNVLMFSFTPPSVRANYAIYTGKHAEMTLPSKLAMDIREMLKGEGLNLI
jgi:biotin synthase